MNFYNHDVDAIAAKLENETTRRARKDEEVNGHKNKWPLLSMYTAPPEKVAEKSSVGSLKSSMFKTRQQNVINSSRATQVIDEGSRNPPFFGKGNQRNDGKAPLASVFTRIANAGLEENQVNQMNQTPLNEGSGSVFSRFKSR